MEKLIQFLYKIRKSLYLGLEMVQGWLLPPAKRMGKYFDDLFYSEHDLLSETRVKIKSQAYLNLLKKIDQKGLFIIGNARSGTSILRRVVNSSDEVCLLGEANLFRNYDSINFVDQFNAQGKNRNQIENKATFISRPLFPEINGLVSLERVGRHYTFCGEKIATGFKTDYQQLFDFQSQYFLNSTYLLIVRRPSEVIWSMSKMFPNRDVSDFILSWLKTLDLILRIYSSFRHANVIFLEDLTPEIISKLEKSLNCSLSFPAEFLSPKKQFSSLENKLVPKALKPYEALLNYSDQIYSSIKEKFSTETFQYKGKAHFSYRIHPTKWAIADFCSAIALFAGNLAFLSLSVEVIFDRNFAVYISGLTDDEILEIDVTKDFLYETSKQKANQSFPFFENLKFSTPQSETRLRIWASTCCLNLLKRKNDTSSVYIIYENILKLDPTNPLGNDYYNRHPKITKKLTDAENLISQKKFSEAVSILKEINQRASNMPKTNYLLGFVHHRLKNLDLAISHYDKALELGFQEFWIYYNRGDVYLKQGNHDAALENLQKADELKPEHLGVIALLDRLASADKEQPALINLGQ